jgi:hypothetical protein
MKALFRFYRAYMVTALGSMLAVLYASWIYVRPLSSLLSSVALGVALAVLRNLTARKGSPAALTTVEAGASENSLGLLKLEQKIKNLELDLASMSQEVERASKRVGLQTDVDAFRKRLQAGPLVDFERIK